MNPAEYQDTQDRLLRAGLDVASLPIDRFLVAGRRADTIGSYADPTLYRQAAGNLAAIRELAEAFEVVAAIMARHDAILLPLAAQAVSRLAAQDLANPEGPH